MSDTRKIVIAGGGTAGWMTAAALSTVLDTRKTSITLVESEAIGTVGVGEATIPDMINFNRMLGVSEAEFMSATQATYKLGIEFVNWGEVGERYFHPFGTHGVDMQGVDFHQYWLATHRNGSSHTIEDYSMCARAAKADRFAHPSKDPKSPLSHMGYAYHLDATRYAAFLRKFAEARGVQRVEGRIAEVSLSAESGNIEYLRLDHGRAISGDFFFDCTGFRSLIMRGSLGVDFVDWGHWLPCDTAQTVATAHTGELSPYTVATAHDAGWQWRIPTQERTGNGHIYSSRFTEDDTARYVFLSHLDGETIGEIRTLSFKTGRLETFWKKNCVGIGLSSGFLEPLESTSIYLIQTGISKFITLFPDANPSQIVIEEYNRQMRQEFDQVRDFIILHYHATQRDDSEFWTYCRTMDVPDSLAYKIELFEAAGRVFRYEEELFSIPSWVAVMLGQNIVPSTLDPIVAQLPIEQVEHSLASMRAGMASVVECMPSHATALEALGSHAA